jgi:hypothetical protein
MTVRFTLRISALLLAAALAGCSSSMSIDRTFEDAERVDRPFSNILVLAVAADYNSRSQFERSLANALESPGTVATEYYEIAAGDREISREKILAAVERYGYDGVIVTQLGGRQSEVSIETPTAGTKVVRRDDRPVDFFRYDYEILNEPYQLNVETEVVLITDFFDAADARRVWSARSTVMNKQNIAYMLEDTATMIAARLQRDGLVAD